MRALITGANGQVAFDLIRLVDANLISLVSYTRAELDISDMQAVQCMMQAEMPDIVINTSAYTKVDQAEKEPEIAFATNRDGAKHLAIVCEMMQIPLLHLSTDYIFDGKSGCSYDERSVPVPLSIYGKSKWEGEQAIRKHCSRHVILRVSSVFGVHGVNFVKTMWRLLQEKESLKVVSDQVMCPTPSTAIADTLWGIVKAIQTNFSWGTYHFCGMNPISWFDFAGQIALELQNYVKVVTKEICPISTEEYGALAPRPLYSVLNCNLLDKTFGIKAADWRKGLNDVVASISAS